MLKLELSFHYWIQCGADNSNKKAYISFIQINNSVKIVCMQQVQSFIPTRISGGARIQFSMHLRYFSQSLVIIPFRYTCLSRNCCRQVCCSNHQLCIWWLVVYILHKLNLLKSGYTSSSFCRNLVNWSTIKNIHLWIAWPLRYRQCYYIHNSLWLIL